MAAIDITRSATNNLFGRHNLLTSIVASFTAWNDARVTRKALSQLTARELDDIGLTFADIDNVAGR